MLTFLLTAALVAAPTQPTPATNTKCPVCGGKVDSKSKRVVVNGREYAICHGMNCQDDLAKSPDKYLKPDGTPKNQK
jgi:YHS domain-containing protein